MFYITFNKLRTKEVNEIEAQDGNKLYHAFMGINGFADHVDFYFRYLVDIVGFGL